MRHTFAVPIRFPLVLTILLVQSISASSFNVAGSPRPLVASSISRTSSSCRTRTPGNILSIRGGDGGRVSSFEPLKVIVVDALSVANDFFVSSPYAAAAITCGTKASAADYVAQRRHFKKREESEGEGEGEGEETEKLVSFDAEQDQSKFEIARNVAFLIYGAVYQGMAQEFIYNHLYPAWFGSGTDAGVVLTKVAFDLFVQTTLITLPIAYLTKALIFRYSFGEGLQRYWEDITTHGLLTKYFCLWGPVQCLTFGVVPEQFRIAFIAVVSFFWLIILSTVSARPRKAETALQDEGCSLLDGTTCNIDG